MADEKPESPEALLRDALYLLNDRPSFTARNRSLNSYEVAARISRFLGERRE